MKNKHKFFYIISESKKSKKLFTKFINIVNTSDDWVIDEKDYNFIFIFGGDGTLLSSVKHIRKEAKVILINGGSFGFFSFFDSKNIETILEFVQNKSNYISPILITTKCDNEKIYSLNELVINSNHLMNLEIYLDGNLYENFRGSGLIISTPLGSTGRNKSNNGAIIAPNLNVVQLLEIEPLSQKEYRTLDAPLILDSKITIDVKVKKIKDNFYLINDGDIIEMNNKKDIKIEFSKAKFKLFYFDKIEDFIKKLKKKYISTE